MLEKTVPGKDAMIWFLAIITALQSDLLLAGIILLLNFFNCNCENKSRPQSLLASLNYFVMCSGVNF
jgi:hypothetical protein